MNWLISQFRDFQLPVISNNRKEDKNPEEAEESTFSSKSTTSTASISESESTNSSEHSIQWPQISVLNSWFSKNDRQKFIAPHSFSNGTPLFNGNAEEAKKLLRDLAQNSKGVPSKLVLKPNPTDKNQMVLESQKRTWRSWLSFSPSLKEREKTASYIKSIFETAYEKECHKGKYDSIDNYLTSDKIHQEGIEAVQKAYQFAEIRSAIKAQFSKSEPLQLKFIPRAHQIPKPIETQSFESSSAFSSESLQQQLSHRENVHDFKASEHFSPLAKGLLTLLEQKKSYPLENIFYDKKTKRVSVPDGVEHAESTKNNDQAALNFQNAAILLTELAAGEYAAKEIKAYLENKSPNKHNLKSTANKETLSEEEKAKAKAISNAKEKEGRFIHVKAPKNRVELILQGVPSDRAKIINLFITASETTDPLANQAVASELNQLLIKHHPFE